MKDIVKRPGRLRPAPENFLSDEQVKSVAAGRRDFLRKSFLAAGAAMAAGLLLIAPGASAAEVGGVKLDDQLSVAGAPLVLNGAGVRYKAVFKVYAAGLYLGRKAASTATNAIK